MRTDLWASSTWRTQPVASNSVPSGGQSAPTISVGVPVYNGEQHLAQALDSLLAQTHGDLEIVISDNASTDRTPALCEQYAARDPRVRYIRQSRNIGAPRNWNAVVEAARGSFFKWASANDYANDRYLETCLQALHDDPGTVLAFGRTCLVDEVTGSTSHYEGDVELLDERAPDRFRRVCRSWALNNAQSGLFRLDVLRKTGLDRTYISGDLVLMAELALYGRFRQVPGATLFRRVGSQSMSSRLPTSQLEELIDPLTKGEQLVAWPRHLDMMASVLRSPVAISDKLECLGIAARGASWDSARLSRELGVLLRRLWRRPSHG